MSLYIPWTGVFGLPIQRTDMPVDGVLNRVCHLWCTVFSLGRGNVELLRMGFLDLMGLRLVLIWRDVMLLIRELDMVMDILLNGGQNLLLCMDILIPMFAVCLYSCYVCRFDTSLLAW